MDISCKIIEDLLPLYIDGVCSEESKKLVEEHLSECSRCEDMFRQMKSTCLPKQDVDVNLNEAEALRDLSKKWNRKLLGAMIKGVISTLLLVGGMLLIVYIFIGFKGA